MITNTVILFGFLISCYALGLLIAKCLKFEFKFFSLIGFTAYLVVAVITTLICAFAFNEAKSISYVIYGSCFLMSYLYLAWYVFKERKNNSIKAVGTDLVVIFLIALVIGLILRNYTSAYPRMYGPLENGVNYLSLINNNFYSSSFLNIDLSTGKALNQFVFDTHLGFYSVLDFILKVSNKIVGNINPLAFGIFFGNQLLLNLVVQVFIYFAIDTYHHNKSVFLAIGFTLVAFTFGFNTLNYGFVSYLYLPLIIGLLIFYLNANNGIKAWLLTIFSLSILALTSNGWLIFILFNVVIYLTLLFDKLNIHINRLVVVCLIGLSIALTWLLKLDISILFDHHGFDYGYEYISHYKNLYLISFVIYVLMILYANKKNILLLSLLVFNPLIVLFIVDNFNLGFLVFDLIFNFGLVSVVYFQLNDTLEKANLSNNRIQTLFIGLSILALYVNTNMHEDTYQLHADLYSQSEYDNYSKQMHIDNEILSVFDYLNQKTVLQQTRVKVISQHPMTSAYVANIELLYDRNHINNLCQYCDVLEANIHEPNALTNIFDYREYADNTLYIEKPQYDNVCSLLTGDSYTYLIIQNDQHVNKAGNYLTFEQLLAECAQPVFVTDTYTLLQVYN